MPGRCVSSRFALPSVRTIARQGESSGPSASENGKRRRREALRRWAFRGWDHLAEGRYAGWKIVTIGPLAVATTGYGLPGPPSSCS